MGFGILEFFVQQDETEIVAQSEFYRISVFDGIMLHLCVDVGEI